MGSTRSHSETTEVRNRPAPDVAFRAPVLNDVLDFAVSIGLLENCEFEGRAAVRLTPMGRVARDENLFPTPKFLNPSYVESFQ